VSSADRSNVGLETIVPRPGISPVARQTVYLTAFCTSWRFIGLLILLALLCGCGADSTGPGGGPFGAPAESRLLAPLAGHWDFDFERTLDAQKAGGATEEQINSLRKLYADNPQLLKMHPDMTITGNEAICSGTPTAEYRFFVMHEHDGKLCGKAWHHEDRFDPGDMSKCYVRLKLEGDRLVFELSMDAKRKNQINQATSVVLFGVASLGAVAGADAGWGWIVLPVCLLSAAMVVRAGSRRDELDRVKPAAPRCPPSADLI
jgi:hypothetical protein